MKRIAVVGGGINGVMTAWALARRGHKVELFEARTLMSGSSSASTKLLHGGLRYLEFFQFSLVREGLRERAWWLDQAPHLAHETRVILPVYRDSARRGWKIKTGLRLYDWLAGRHGLQPHRRLTRSEAIQLIPALNRDGLLEAYAFSDGQMDDHALGNWAAEQAREASVAFREATPVERIGVDGTVVVNGAVSKYDLVYNIAGPWASELLERSGIKSRYRLNLVKGSHLLLDVPMPAGLFVQAPSDSRFVFILPYQGRTLVGTTEVSSSLDAPMECSKQERDYLLSVVSRFLGRKIAGANLVGSFAGLRPLVSNAQAESATRSSREYAMERQGSLVSVFGGKWTTSRALGMKAAELAC